LKLGLLLLYIPSCGNAFEIYFHLKMRFEVGLL